MKKLILFSILLLAGCSTPKLTTTSNTPQVQFSDTTNVIKYITNTVDLTRQQRLALEKYYKHLESVLKLELKEVKIENRNIYNLLKQYRKINSDSLDYEIDKSKIESKMYKDSLKFSKRSLKIVTDAYSDSLKYEKRKHNKTVNGQKHVAKWWVWVIVIVLFLIIILLLIRK